LAASTARSTSLGANIGGPSLRTPLSGRTAGTTFCRNVVIGGTDGLMRGGAVTGILVGDTSTANCDGQPRNVLAVARAV